MPFPTLKPSPHFESKFYHHLPYKANFEDVHIQFGDRTLILDIKNKAFPATGLEPRNT